MDQFLKYWFGGLEKGIDHLSEAERVTLFEQCGKACSDSYTKALYQEIWEETRNYTDFFHRLGGRVEEIDIKEVEKDRQYTITYHKCLCDLYTRGYMSTGCLCECSRQSLLYNLTTICPDKTVEVQLIDSILRGGKQCILQVSLAETI